MGKMRVCLVQNISSWGDRKLLDAQYDSPSICNYNNREIQDAQTRTRVCYSTAARTFSYRLASRSPPTQIISDISVNKARLLLDGRSFDQGGFFFTTQSPLPIKARLFLFERVVHL